MPAYEVRNLVKRYAPDLPPANDGLSLDIYQGEIFGLLGPNGAGKTTLVRQLTGLTRPTSGTIRLFGHDVVADPSLIHHWVALQPQGLALPSQEMPRELLVLTGQLRGMTVAAARKQADELIEAFNLGGKLKVPFHRLSGGQRRLISIALALMGDRPVLVFDEPTNDLDPEVRRVVWQRIQEGARGGRTVILVTHNVVEAETVLDRVAIVRRGQILALGTPGELKGRVAGNVRLELLFRPGGDEQAAGWLLERSAIPMGARRYAVIVPRPQAAEAISDVLPRLELLDDFRIVTPNLEDVYLELSGGESIGS
ncbi:ABC transporter ATP-binding protein [Symbiobacterium terraclitae]|uniref:ABC transporter ATP-binding protein n=1 Tax=Symbiobacterium terraclitae TaxID=557451 RepID=UPI0031599C08